MAKGKHKDSGIVKETTYMFFEYRLGRHKRFPIETLSQFSGAVQTDGYVGYNEVIKRSDIIGLACFAHARRKFKRALSNDKKHASWFLKCIKYLYVVVSSLYF